MSNPDHCTTLKNLRKTACTKLVHAVLSYDGAYQVRSGKSGGGFSPYCFESAIFIDMGKVVAYEVGCNSCRECTLYGNKLREKEITEGHASSRTKIEVN